MKEWKLVRNESEREESVSGWGNESDRGRESVGNESERKKTECLRN